VRAADAAHASVAATAATAAAAAATAAAAAAAAAVQAAERLRLSEGRTSEVRATAADAATAAVTAARQAGAFTHLPITRQIPHNIPKFPKSPQIPHNSPYYSNILAKHSHNFPKYVRSQYSLACALAFTHSRGVTRHSLVQTTLIPSHITYLRGLRRPAASGGP
jgi:hypothetical protein